MGEGRGSETEDGRELEWHPEPESRRLLTQDGKTPIHVPSSAVEPRYARASEP